MNKQPIRFVVCLMALLPAMAIAQPQSISLTREALDEAKRLCEINARNDQARYVLLTGMLEQSRFEGGVASSCNPVEQGAPCEKPDWFPPRYTAHLVKTNFYPPRQKVAVHVASSETIDVKAIELFVGQPYALCVEADDYRAGKPHFTLPHLSGLYQLMPAEQ